MNARRTIPFTHFLMLFSLTITTLLLLVTGVVLYNKTKHILMEKISLIHSMKLNQASADMRKQFEDLYKSFDGFRNHDSILGTVRRLSAPGNTGFDQYLLTRTLQTSISNFKIGNPLIEHMIVMTPKQQFSSNFKYMEYFLAGNELSLRLEQEQIVFVPPGRTYELFQQDRSQVTDRLLLNLLDPLEKSMYFVCRLNSLNGEQIGLMFMLLSNSALKTLVPYADSIAILDADGTMLYKGDDVEPTLAQQFRGRVNGEVDSVTLQGKRYELRPIGFNGLRLLFVEPEIIFGRQQIRLIAWYSGLTLLGTALLSFVLSRWIGRKILIPLHGLVRWIRGFERLEDRWVAGGDLPIRPRITTMRDRFFVYFLLTILVPILLFVTLFYLQSTRMVSKEVQQTYYALFEKSVHRLELFVKQKEMAMTWLAFHSVVTSYIEQPNENASEHMDELLFTGTFASLSEDAVSIYDRSNQLIYSNRFKHSSKMDESLFTEMQTQRNMLAWLPPSDTGSSTISFVMPIADISESSEILGFLKTDVNAVFFSSLYSELNVNGSEAYVVDDQGRMISSPEIEKVGQIAKLPAQPDRLDLFLQEDSALQYFSMPITGLPWHLVTSFDASQLREQAIDMIYDDIYLFTIILLLTLFFSYFMSQYLVRPLAATHEKAARMELSPGERIFQADRYKIDEVEQLRASFNRLLERIEQLVEEKLLARDEYRLLELEKRETQLEALQAQINPHFLHNTLEIVMYMIEEGERENAVNMIGLLSRLFRYAMGKESQLTPLRDEVTYAKTYIRIMSFRYKDKIQCEWRMEDELLECTVVKMILQPILENAIRHTLHSGVSQVRITVDIARVGDDLRIEIADNGPSIAQEKLAVIRDTLERRDRGKVGLYNVNSRVKLHFGEMYGVEIESAEHGGVSVVMRLPVKTSLSLD